jgi:hypothetical protein
MINMNRKTLIIIAVIAAVAFWYWRSHRSASAAA